MPERISKRESFGSSGRIRTHNRSVNINPQLAGRSAYPPFSFLSAGVAIHGPIAGRRQITVWALGATGFVARGRRCSTARSRLSGSRRCSFTTTLPALICEASLRRPTSSAAGRRSHRQLLPEVLRQRLLQPHRCLVVEFAVLLDDVVSGRKFLLRQGLHADEEPATITFAASPTARCARRSAANHEG